MSKILDKRQGMVAALLGLDECPFPLQHKPTAQFAL